MTVSSNTHSTHDASTCGAEQTLDTVVSSVPGVGCHTPLSITRLATCFSWPDLGLVLFRHQSSGCT